MTTSLTPSKNTKTQWQKGKMTQNSKVTVKTSQQQSAVMTPPTVPAFRRFSACTLPVTKAYKLDKFGLVVSSICTSTMDGSYLVTFRNEAAKKWQIWM
jgi:hypothetical protein